MRPTPPPDPEVHKLFRAAIKHRASGLYLNVGLPPSMKIKEVVRETALPPLTQQGMRSLLHPILSDEQLLRLDQTGEVAFTHVFDNDSRFLLFVTKKDNQLALAAHWLGLT